MQGFQDFSVKALRAFGSRLLEPDVYGFSIRNDGADYTPAPGVARAIVAVGTIAGNVRVTAPGLVRESAGFEWAVRVGLSVAEAGAGFVPSDHALTAPHAVKLALGACVLGAWRDGDTIVCEPSVSLPLRDAFELAIVLREREVYVFRRDGTRESVPATIDALNAELKREDPDAYRQARINARADAEDREWKADRGARKLAAQNVGALASDDREPVVESEPAFALRADSVLVSAGQSVVREAGRRALVDHARARVDRAAANRPWTAGEVAEGYALVGGVAVPCEVAP